MVLGGELPRSPDADRKHRAYCELHQQQFAEAAVRANSDPLTAEVRKTTPCEGYLREAGLLVVSEGRYALPVRARTQLRTTDLAPVPAFPRIPARTGWTAVPVARWLTSGEAPSGLPPTKPTALETLASCRRAPPTPAEADEEF